MPRPRHESAALPNRRDCLNHLLILGSAGLGLTSPSARAVQTSSATPFQFAVIGDAPYTNDDASGLMRAFLHTRDDINRHEDLAWVVHVGDFKDGSGACSEDLIQRRQALFRTFQAPLIYTPGDNDWTDCHRQGGEPLEQLSLLRQHLFADNKPLTGWQRQSQHSNWTEFVENQSWQQGQVGFATIHLVGSANGLVPFAKRSPAHDVEVRRRTAAAIAALHRIFDEAKQHAWKALTLFTHVSLPFARPLDPVQNPWGEWMTALAQRAMAFKKPVLLVHGDTHRHRLDQPLMMGNKQLPNVLRLESFGHPSSAWIKVRVDPEHSDVFSVSTHRVDEDDGHLLKLG